MAPEAGKEQGRNAQQAALHTTHSAAPQGQRFAPLALAVLGVVYGDIGTSPIYALRECFAGADPMPVTVPNVLGVLSLILWTLILVISLKYMTFVLRADNRGEGGTLRYWPCCAPIRDANTGHAVHCCCSASVAPPCSTAAP